MSVDVVRATLAEARGALDALLASEAMLGEIARAGELPAATFNAGGKYAESVQELHIKVIHILIELVERRLAPQNYAKG